MRTGCAKVRSMSSARSLICLGAALAAILPTGAVQSGAPVRTPVEKVSIATPLREWPSDSLYQFDVPLQTAEGRQRRFADASSGARIVTLFYADCPMVCPLTIDTLKRLDAALSPTERAKLGYLLITLDPEHDDPAALSRVARERKIARDGWTLARASAADTRKLAAALGIQYRALNDGEFQHSSVLVLLDAQGRVVTRSGVTGKPAPEFVAAVRGLVD
jgi:protein SCO1